MVRWFLVETIQKSEYYNLRTLKAVFNKVLMSFMGYLYMLFGGERDKGGSHPDSWP